MSSILDLTDRLLSATGHGPLPDFIAEHVERGETPAEVRISLYKASGQMFDLRTVRTWMGRYA